MGVDRLDPIAHFGGACPANLFPWSILEFPTSTSSKTSSWLDNATKLKRNTTTTFDITILCWVLYSRGVQLYGQLVVEVFVLLKKNLLSFMFTSLKKITCCTIFPWSFGGRSCSLKFSWGPWL